jgi:biopolymer transport protein ExbD
MKKSISGQTLSKDEQQAMAGAMMGSPIQNESRRKKSVKENWNRQWRIQISESEIQQAQVILAAQDLVDQVQKMIEQCTSVQFKDLPALVNQVKNEVGYDKAVQFNQDAGTAFSTLVQSMQTAKLQLEESVGIITGQQGSIPAVGSPSDQGAMPPASPGEEMDFDMDADFEEPDMGGEEVTLGRKRVSESRRPTKKGFKKR